MAKVSMTLEISDKDAKAISENSIERVINTTLEILEKSKHSNSYTNQQDWLESKRIVVTLWLRLQDALFRKANNMEPQE